MKFVKFALIIHLTTAPLCLCYKYVSFELIHDSSTNYCIHVFPTNGSSAKIKKCNFGEKQTFRVQKESGYLHLVADDKLCLKKVKQSVRVATCPNNASTEQFKFTHSTFDEALLYTPKPLTNAVAVLHDTPANGRRLILVPKKYSANTQKWKVVPNNKVCHNWVQVGSDIDGESSYSKSGSSVALSADGNTLAIGVMPDSSSDGSVTAGSVRVYQWTGSIWNQIGSNITGNAPGDWSGTSISLSSDGKVLAIGASRNNGVSSGYVHVYSWNGSIWSKIASNIEGGGWFFGRVLSLASDANILAVNDRFTNERGRVRVYQLDCSVDCSTWTQRGSELHGEASDDRFGWAISLSSDGNTLAVGARHNSDNGYYAGHVRIYQWNGSDWSKIGSDIGGEAPEDRSGWSVSLSSDGKIVAIGARHNSDNGSNSGHVRVYQWTDSHWSQLGEDIDGEARNYWSGTSVSLSSDGRILAIGAPYGNNVRGQVRVYHWNGSVWKRLGSDIDGNNRSHSAGYAISLSSGGTVVAVGAPFTNGANGAWSGRVRVFSCI